MLEKEQELFSSLPMTSFVSGNTNLFDENQFETNAASRNEPAVAMIANDMGGYARLIGLYNTLKDEWFALPEEFRKECKKFITEADITAYKLKGIQKKK